MGKLAMLMGRGRRVGEPVCCSNPARLLGELRGLKPGENIRGLCSGGGFESILDRCLRLSS